MMTNEIVRRSLKRVAAGMVCVALLSQAVPTIGSAAADQYDSSDDNTGTTVLVIAGVGAAAYFISHAAYQKNHPKMPTP